MIYKDGVMPTKNDDISKIDTSISKQYECDCYNGKMPKYDYSTNTIKVVDCIYCKKGINNENKTDNETT